MSIADNIKRLREQHGLTQRELGEIAGVSDKAVSTWELGLKEPRMSAISKLAAYFGITKSALLDGESAPAGGFPAAVERLCAAWGRTPERVERELPLPHGRMLLLRRGEATPTDAELALFAEYFHVPRAVLLGEPVLPEGSNVVPLAVDPPPPSLRDGGDSEVPFAANRIPVLGRVPAGVPLEAVTDIVDEVEIDSRLAATGYDYFGLLVTGDSMFPEYRDGDVVILRAQSFAETGDDVVAYIGGSDATLKRIAVLDEGIELRPINPAYPVRRFSGGEVEALPVTIGGIVVEQRRIRRR